MSSIGLLEIVVVGILGILFFDAKQLAQALHWFHRTRESLRKWQYSTRQEIESYLENPEGEANPQIGIRRRAKKMLDGETPEILAQKSRQLCEKIQEHPLFRDAKRIAAFVPHGTEPDIFPLLKEALRLSKELWLPLVNSELQEMEMISVSDLRTDLEKGYCGIREPRAALRPAKPCLDFDLVLVPGCVFGEKGERIGRGGGFYDRFLARLKRGERMGVCFRDQLVSTPLPQSETDMVMHFAASEKGIFAPQKGRML